MRRPRSFAMVLAGGEGKRLAPLTADRAKPAVPFGGHYRLIDFVLSNLVNAGFVRIAVLTQYKSHSLDRHISTTWRLSGLLGNYVTTVPAQMRRGKRWFLGSADAIYQNLNLIRDEQPDHIAVFGADHVYRMDPRQMMDEHIESGAGVTVAGIRVPVGEAGQFGIIETEPDGCKIRAFLEKPDHAEGLPDAPDQAFASMGNYVFNTEALIDAVIRDADDDESSHDVGGDIIPMLVKDGVAAVYDFADNRVPGVAERDRHYWRDVGTIDSYYDAHMEVLSTTPVFNLHNNEWPILTWTPPMPPATILSGTTPGEIADSMICAGAVVHGGVVRRSVISPGARVHPGAAVEDSVVLHDTEIGEGAVVRRAILDKEVRVPPGALIGVDPEEDRRRFTGAQGRFTISEGGVVVIGKGERLA